ncbi:uncharacterized protein LOC110036625 [Phalaenopsis equestris]|uniref:uncharacterized protein LOC110036625 n=1 Tax=Phalaenopsis equestris TaxID=78828 RepID=UPI0009E354D2|nr:uncharacterized protein LOC110036625 [Phalaenopsis equestris]
MARHGSAESPDVQDLVPNDSSGAELMQPVLKLEKEKADGLRSESLTSTAQRDLNEEMKNITISGSDEREVMVAEPLTGDAKDLATSKTSVPQSVKEGPKTLSSTKEDDILDFRNPDDAPHLFFNPESQTREELKLDQRNSTSLGPSDKEIVISVQHHSHDGLEGNEGNPIKKNFLSDERLDPSGDYEWQLNNLSYAVYCHELTSNPHFIPMGHAISYSDFIRGQNA